VGGLFNKPAVKHTAGSMSKNFLPAGLPFLPAFPCPQTTPELAGGRRRRHGTDPQERTKSTTASSIGRVPAHVPSLHSPPPRTAFT
jgi:hypothetical protein